MEGTWYVWSFGQGCQWKDEQSVICKRVVTLRGQQSMNVIIPITIYLTRLYWYKRYLY